MKQEGSLNPGRAPMRGIDASRVFNGRRRGNTSMQLYLFSFIHVYVASKFATDLLDGETSACPSAMANVAVDQKFPELEKCFEHSSLFFSTVHDICSSRCRDHAVGASQYLVKECKLGKPAKHSPVLSNKYLVYSVWADREAVDVICAKSTYSNTCLHDFTQASVELAGGSTRAKCSTRMNKHCTPCNSRIYQKFKLDSYAIPSVYYQTVLDPELLLEKLGSLCRWS